MKLPNADNAVIPTEKLRDYLLSSSHPVGRFKAVFFRALGYTDGDWERLEADIRSILINDATLGGQTDYGQKLEVIGTITGPVQKHRGGSLVWMSWDSLRSSQVVEEGPTSFGAYVPDVPGCVAVGNLQ